MKISIVIIKFLFIGALFIVSNENLYLNNPADLEIFYDTFFSWIQGISNQAIQISGYVVNSEWLPGNSSADIIT